MVERNLLTEGFISNTLAPGGSISGTQVLSIAQMDALVDGNVSSTAVAITGSFFTSLDADLGARWKLNRIELYTDEPTSLNFDMKVSVDNLNFYPLTMTGSAGLWVSSVSGTTVSGAPRYLRYAQIAPSLRNVQEWRVINDDSLVDFGTTGTQTTASIEDAPIGKPSDQVTELKLFNRFSQTAQGFVFIDETGNKGDDNIQIALSPAGPWFGKRTQNGNQPDVVKWIDLESISDVFGKRSAAPAVNQFLPVGDIFEGQNEQSITSNLRVVPGTAYRTEFETGLSKGWTTIDFLSYGVADYQFIGNVSTSTTPKLALNQDYGSSNAVSPDSVPDVSNNFHPFRAEDYDTTELSITNPFISHSDLVEGPRLFWKLHFMNDFDTAHSTLSTTPNLLGNGSPQTVLFELGSVPTWSGVVAGLRIQPWTTATGIGLTTRMSSLEIFKDGIEGRDRLALDFDTVISGSFIDYNEGSGNVENLYAVVINLDNVIKETCLITSVSARQRPAEDTTFTNEGWFLCRFRDGFAYNNSGVSLNPAAANPFIVKQVTFNSAHNTVDGLLTHHKPVYWPAEPGDMLGYGHKAAGGLGAGEGRTFAFDLNITTSTGGALASASFVDLTTPATLEASLNSLSNWTANGKRPNIQFKSVSASKYLGSGEYTTPIFDGGGEPALISFEFESQEDFGTSIDVGGGATLDTIYARASSTTPNTDTTLGKRRQEFMLGAHPTDIPSQFDSRYESNYVIGLFNSEVTTRENSTSTAGDTSIINIGVSSLWHEINQELWVINVLLSGTVNTNLRPTWDVYDLGTVPPNYLRTQSVAGSIAYTHNNDSATGDVNTFEVVSFVADYDREEIYIITREDEFKVGSGSYNGIILDLDGNYKDVFWRTEQLTQQIVDAGFENSTTNAFRHLQNMRKVIYKAPYFYALTSSVLGSSSGTRIEVYRLGSDPLEPDNVNAVAFITSVLINSIAGIPVTVSEGSPVDLIAYCSANDLFYCIKDDSSDIFTLRSAVTGDPPDDNVTFTVGPISQTGVPFGPQLFASNAFAEGFTPIYDYALLPWDGQGEEQQYKRMLDLTYCEARDSFIELLAYRSDSSRDFVRFGEFALDHFLWQNQVHTVMIELAAQVTTINAEPIFPKFAALEDPLWGTQSGTLPFVQVAENSILFPTGRYAQLRYRLNANSTRTSTPYLIQSKVNQGLRVADIPSSGTKTIYLRTNIPDGEVIGDQSTNLKVFWELRGS